MATLDKWIYHIACQQNCISQCKLLITTKMMPQTMNMTHLINLWRDSMNDSNNSSITIYLEVESFSNNMKVHFSKDSFMHVPSKMSYQLLFFITIMFYNHIYSLFTKFNKLMLCKKYRIWNVRRIFLSLLSKMMIELLA